MKQSGVTVDAEWVTRVTHSNIQWADIQVCKVLAYMQDQESQSRLKQQLCRYCFYLHSSRLGGAAMTTRPCGVCKKDVMYGSTATDDICETCAKKHLLCKQCGGDLHMRAGRVVDFTRKPKVKAKKTVRTFTPMMLLPQIPFECLSDEDREQLGATNKDYNTIDKED